jgi:hypothetical protein
MCQYHFRVVVTAHTHVYVTRLMSASIQSVSAVIRSVSALPALQIDVVCSDPRPVLLPPESSGRNHFFSEIILENEICESPLSKKMVF